MKKQSIVSFGFGVGLVLAQAAANAAPFSLSSGTGDGSVQVGVDGYGAFGSATGTDSSNAIYDPIGTIAASGTVFNSAVAIRIGTTGARTFLTSGTVTSNPGSLVNPTVTGSTTSGNSSFTYSGLSFQLGQTVGLSSVNGATSGSHLTQTYRITNTTNAPITFDLTRYLDGDLLFDGSLIDGGGKIAINGQTTLFETDSATGASDSTTFVGIDAVGGTAPANGFYQISSYSGLAAAIAAGTALTNTIQGDGNNDGFIDTGAGYDVTLALLNSFTINAGQSSTYTTDTLFGTGAPAAAAPPSLPEPVSSSMIMLGCGLLMRRRAASRA